MSNNAKKIVRAFYLSDLLKDETVLYRGWQVSQPVTDKDDTTESYERVKV